MNYGALIVGCLVGVAIVVVSIPILMMSEKRREALKRFWAALLSLFEPAPPLPPVAVIEPPPPPEDEPEAGNVTPRKSEWEVEPEPERRYQFPDRPDAVTRYEDFNRRLFIQKGNALQLPKNRLPLRAFNDYPCPLPCGDAVTRTTVSAEIRPLYPIIYDTMGWFAVASALLEKDPYYRDAITDAYLAVPEARRPVVVSAASPHEKANTLTFMRYGFEDFILPTRFLNPYPVQSLAYIFKALMGEREDWLWFSPARLRKHVTDEVTHAEFIRQQKARQESAQTVRSKLVEVLQTNDFSSLWSLRDTRLANNEKATADAAPAAEEKV